MSRQISVQVRKNPGLGFSIAGGVVGNETVNIFFFFFVPKSFKNGRALQVQPETSQSALNFSS